MEIKQKKFSNKHVFKFGDESLNFAFKDKTGSDDFDLHYANFPDKSSVSIERNEWLRNVGGLWCLLGCYQLGTAIYNDLPLTGRGFWLLIGLLCLGWFAFTKIKYSVFKTEYGNIFVINDRKHDQIIDEIKSRKKAQLSAWYGEINLDNGLDHEISKFRWLAEMDVITDQEAEEKIAAVEFAHKSDDSHGNILN
ncbi:hypothetical protein [Vibrio gallaecicus]|uniref:Uncharacterized protein n=1 Tax=Vibrio gallaecicus TaxID=552386 RepID=A0ABV4N6I0_9VIBR